MFLAKTDISQFPLEIDMVMWLSNQWNVSKSIMLRTSGSWGMLLLSFFQMLGIWNLMTGASAAILHNEAPKNKNHVLGMMEQKDRRNVGVWWLYRHTNSRLPVSGLVLHRPTKFYHFGVTPHLDFPLHATKLNPNYHKREDWNHAACGQVPPCWGEMPWQAVCPPSGSPLEPLVRRVFSDGGESKVATVPPVALVIGAAGFGPFGLNPCLPGLYTRGVGYTGASTHWFGTYKDSRVRESALGREGKSCPRWWDLHCGPGWSQPPTATSPP